MRTKKIIRFLVIGITICMIPSALLATTEIDKLISNFFQSNHKLNEFNLVIKNSVFALVRDDAWLGPKDSFRFPINDFQQEVTLFRSSYFITEVYKEKARNNVSAVYIKTINQSKFLNLREDTTFSFFDSVPLYYRLFSKNTTVFKDILASYGIPDNSYKILQRNNTLFYQIGDEKQNLVIRSGVMRLEEINLTIHMNDEDQKYQIRFTDWHSRYPQLPVSAEHYLNKLLIKKNHIENALFANNRSRARKKLIEYSK